MKDYRALARAAAIKYGIDAALFEKQMGVESDDYSADVISGKRTSDAGAKGIAQLMPTHWQNVDPTNPEASLDYAARMMAGYVQQYGDYPTALAAYNAGPGNVNKYNGIPPFAETQSYVKQVMSAQGGLPMAKPNDPQIYDQHEVWIDANGNPVRPNSPGATRHRITTYDDGHTEAEDWIPAESTGGILGRFGTTPPGPNDGSWSESYPTPTPKDVAARYKVDTAGKAPSTRVGADKNTYVYNPDTGQYELAPGMPTHAPSQLVSTGEGLLEYTPGQQLPSGVEGPGLPSSSRFIYRDPNADITRSSLEAQLAETRARTADIGNRHLTPEEMQLQGLDVQKAQRALANPLLLAQQQHDEAITAIQNQLASGAIDHPTANKMMDMVRANLQASLQGTTPWQVDQDKVAQQQKKQELARNVLADQLGYGSSLASGLLSGLGSIYGKVLSSSKPPAVDPFTLAQGFTQQMGGGQQLGDMAKNVLQGALSGGQQ